MNNATPSVLGGTWTILRARWRVARNTFWRGGLSRKVGVILGVVAALGIAAFLTFVSTLIVRGLRFVARERPEVIDQIGGVELLFAAVPSLALAFALLPLLFSSVSFALATFYLSRDIDTLLVTPVPIRSVFIARFAEGLATSWLMLAILLGAPLAGYGIGLGYGPLFFGVLIAVLLLLPLLPISFGTLLTMLLVRVVPARRLREVMTLVGGVFGALVWLGTQVIGGRFNDTPRAVDATALLRFDVPVLPTSWGARALIAAGGGDYAMLLGYGGLYVLATLGMFMLCVVVAERLYYNGWTNMTSTTGGRVRRGRDRAPLLRGPVGAIVRKDVRTLPRDLQQVSQIFVGLLFALFWLWQFTREGPDRTPFGNIGAASASVFICLLLASNLGLNGLSREGRSVWLLQLAPISPWTILRAKWVLAYVPFPLFGLIFAVFLLLVRNLPVSDVLYIWLLLALIGTGVASITTGVGAIFPRFDWDNPRTMTSNRASLIGLIAYTVYSLLILALLSGAPWLAELWGWWVHAAGWSLALGITAFAAWLPLRLAAERMRGLEL